MLLITALLLTPVVVNAGKDKDAASRVGTWAEQSIKSIDINCPYDDCKELFNTTNYVKQFWLVRCPNCEKNVIIDTRFGLDRIRVTTRHDISQEEIKSYLYN